VLGFTEERGLITLGWVSIGFFFVFLLWARQSRRRRVPSCRVFHLRSACPRERDVSPKELMARRDCSRKASSRVDARVSAH
jgi:hypothetical protein